MDKNWADAALRGLLNDTEFSAALKDEGWDERDIITFSVIKSITLLHGFIEVISTDKPEMAELVKELIPPKNLSDLLGVLMSALSGKYGADEGFLATMEDTKKLILQVSGADPDKFEEWLRRNEC